MSEDDIYEGSRTRGAEVPAPDTGEATASLLDAAPYRIGSVALVVRDLDGLARFYRDVVGLATVSREAGKVRLGIGDSVLLELRHEPAVRLWTPREAGLFHTAFLLPRRGDLGEWLRHAAGLGIRLSGGADHLVSEAVYLTDPEGNGIDIYVDRPAVGWPISDAGRVVMRNDPLDHAGLIRASSGPWAGMPDGGRIGHVHLQVGDLGPAERFYADRLGFAVTCRYPDAIFLGSGGYHHQLAINVWNSRGAPARLAHTTGLAGVEVLARPEAMNAIRLLREATVPPTDEDGKSLVFQDPWGTRLSFAPSAVSGESGRP